MASSKISADDLSTLTHSQLAAALQIANGTCLTADSGVSRIAVIKICADHFSAADLIILQTPESRIYPDRWDSPAESTSVVSNRLFQLPKTDSSNSTRGREPPDANAELSQIFTADTSSMDQCLQGLAKAEAKAFSGEDGKGGESSAMQAFLRQMSMTMQKLSKENAQMRKSTADLIPRIKLKPKEKWVEHQTLRAPTIKDTSSAKWSESVIPQTERKNDLQALPLGSLRSIGETLVNPKLQWGKRLQKFRKRFPPLPATMVAHAPQPTTFESAVKAAMKEQPGLGLVMEMAPEIQKRELQLWQSLAWIRSEFDRMIKVVSRQQRLTGTSSFIAPIPCRIIWRTIVMLSCRHKT